MRVRSTGGHGFFGLNLAQARGVQVVLFDPREPPQHVDGFALEAA